MSPLTSVLNCSFLHLFEQPLSHLNLQKSKTLVYLDSYPCDAYRDCRRGVLRGKQNVAKGPSAFFPLTHVLLAVAIFLVSA